MKVEVVKKEEAEKERNKEPEQVESGRFVRTLNIEAEVTAATTVIDADRGRQSDNLTARRAGHTRGSLSFSLPSREYLVEYHNRKEERKYPGQQEQQEHQRTEHRQRKQKLSEQHRGSSCPRLIDEGRGKCATVKGNGGFGDYSAAGEFEVWGEERVATDGGGGGVSSTTTTTTTAKPPSRQQRCEGGSVLRPLLHVAHCELHSPREAELLRLDHLEALDHKSSLEHDAYSMMDNFHSPVPPPLPRRHVR
ncbi:hypothetical protein KPH14_003907 [Odynerus spinipes]|uniref:Uncharacterized protein n=1 Tax=Odynerus spinipes TaxID=1348599 RepID=A0AAD9RXJ4_9HYME|nr:hypothetical protein KPH14_003907 [Odynerus spinipes]